VQQARRLPKLLGSTTESVTLQLTKADPAEQLATCISLVDGDTTAATCEGAATTACGGPAVEGASAPLCCRASRPRPARMDCQAAKPAFRSSAMSLGPGTSLRRCREVTEPI